MEHYIIFVSKFVQKNDHNDSKQVNRSAFSCCCYNKLTSLSNESFNLDKLTNLVFKVCKEFKLCYNKASFLLPTSLICPAS